METYGLDSSPSPAPAATPSLWLSPSPYSPCLSLSHSLSDYLSPHSREDRWLAGTDSDGSSCSTRTRSQAQQRTTERRATARTLCPRTRAWVCARRSAATSPRPRSMPWMTQTRPDPDDPSDDPIQSHSPAEPAAALSISALPPLQVALVPGLCWFLPPLVQVNAEKIQHAVFLLAITLL